MIKIVIAAYDDIVVAQETVEDLVNAYFPRRTINLITKDTYHLPSHAVLADTTPKEMLFTPQQAVGFGALVGFLAGLGALMIPPIGLAIAFGPIIAVLTGVVAGAIMGGSINAFIAYNMSEDETLVYAEIIRRGGTLVSIQTPDVLRAEDIMQRSGAINIAARVNEWRQNGWQGLNTPPVKAPSIMAAPMSLNTSPMAVAPTHPMLTLEPPTSDDDTAKSFSVHVTEATVGGVPARPSVFETITEVPLMTDETDTVYQNAAQ